VQKFKKSSGVKGLREILTRGRKSSRQVQDLKMECIWKNKNKLCPFKKLYVLYKSCLKTFGSHLVEADLKVTSGEGKEKNDTLITNATENGRYAEPLVNTKSLKIVQRHPNDTARLIPHQESQNKYTNCD
jgi:hypothetical protein